MTHSINEPLWHHLTQEVMSGMRDWRVQHPTATLREIETETRHPLGPRPRPHARRSGAP